MTARKLLVLGALLMCGLSGCGTAVSEGRSTALSADDLESMASMMAESILTDPDVQRAVAERGALKVVVLPVQNLLTGEVLPAGQARMFTAQVRVLLSRARTGSFIWVNNRDTFYALRERQLEGLDLGPAPEAVNPEYALHATFRSLTDDNKHRRATFYQAIFALTSLDNRTTLWTDVYNVRKTAVKGFLD